MDSDAAVAAILFAGLAAAYGISAFVVVIVRVRSYRRQREFDRSAAAAAGTVIDLIPGYGWGNVRMVASSLTFHDYIQGFGPTHAHLSLVGKVPLFPVVEFAPPGQSPIRFADQRGSPRPWSYKGQTIEVRFDPSDPHRAQIAGAGVGRRYVVSLAAVLLVIAVVLGGCAHLAIASHHSSPSPISAGP